MTLSKKRKKLTELHDRIGVITELRRLNGGAAIAIWRGKPVIPVARWESMLSSNFRNALGYFPNGYTDFYEKKILPAMLSEQYNATELEVWKEGYFAFLEHTSNPVRGRELCAGCLLNPSDDLYGLRKIFTNTLHSSAVLKRKEYDSPSPGENEPSNHIYSSGPENHRDANGDSPYPCKILNRFECPYKTTKAPYNDEGLIELGKSLQSIEAALTFASELTNEEENERYEVDFDHDIVNSGPEFPTTGTIEDLPDPKAVRLSHISDIHNALTNSELLDKVLYQYFSHEMPDSNLKQNRDRLVKFVMAFRDKIKAQDLHDGCGRNIEDSEEEFRRMQKRAQYIA